jgi:hypothetical protein
MLGGVDAEPYRRVHSNWNRNIVDTNTAAVKIGWCRIEQAQMN